MVKPLEFLKKFLINSKDNNVLTEVIETIEFIKANYLDVKEFGSIDLEIEESNSPKTIHIHSLSFDLKVRRIFKRTSKKIRLKK